MSYKCSICQMPATYGYCIMDKLYCNNHKLPGMINVFNVRCQYNVHNGKVCCYLANYNYPWSTKVMYCALHKSVDMVDMQTYKRSELELSLYFSNQNIDDNDPELLKILDKL